MTANRTFIAAAVLAIPFGFALVQPIEASATSDAVATQPGAAVDATNDGAAAITVITPAADAFVRQSHPSANTGSAVSLRARKNPADTSYLRFEVPAIDIGSATLRLRVRPTERTKVAVREVSGSWDEDGINAANAPAVGRLVAKVTVRNKRQWIDVDVSSIIDGPGSYTFAIVGLRLNQARFYSRESNSPPQLVVSDRGEVVMAAAGDIACDPSDGGFNDGQGTDSRCRQMHTSDLVLGIAPDVVAALGDLQYPSGERDDFMGSYDPSWGRFYDITMPASGNHEYDSAGAAGYYAYWGSRAGDPDEGYYSYDVGSWHVVVLNTNCSDADCSLGGSQEDWLRADLAASDAVCTLAYGHRSRFSNGFHGGSDRIENLTDVLYEAGVDLYLSGHEHSYERMAPLDPDGNIVWTGIRNIIVGTGGKSLREGSINPAPSTQAWDDRTYGILRLDLNSTSYRWEFINDGSGDFTDSGSGICH